jgi:hypothetical protein
MVNEVAELSSQGRKISLSLYMAALLISAIIFAVGIYVGQLLERETLGSVSTLIDLTSQKSTSLELLYLVGDSPRFCPVYSDELLQIDGETEQIGYRLQYMEEKKGIQDDPVKLKYFMQEATAYLLSKKVQEKCGANFSTVLYFYSIKGCEFCSQQGNELMYLKKTLGDNVKIYSFDGELGSPIVEVLKDEYGVRSYPSIVVDGNHTRSGLQSEQDIFDLLKAR